MLTLQETGTVLQSVCTILHSQKQWMRISVALHFQQLVLSDFFFNLSYFNRCTLIFHCCFNFHFPNDKYCWSSRMLTSQLCIFFGEPLFRALSHIKNCVFCVFILEWTSVLMYNSKIWGRKDNLDGPDTLACIISFQPKPLPMR